ECEDRDPSPVLATLAELRAMQLWREIRHGDVRLPHPSVELPGRSDRGFVEQVFERFHLEQEQAEVEEHVDDLCTRDEITSREALERFVDHLGELLLVHGHDLRGQQPIGSRFPSWITFVSWPLP